MYSSVYQAKTTAARMVRIRAPKHTDCYCCSTSAALGRKQGRSRGFKDALFLADFLRVQLRDMPLEQLIILQLTDRSVCSMHDRSVSTMITVLRLMSLFRVFKNLNESHEHRCFTGCLYRKKTAPDYPSKSDLSSLQWLP